MRNNWFSQKKKCIPRIFFSRNVVNSIKYKKNITPPPPQTTVTPTFEIQNQNKGIEDIMDIDSNCPYLLFGETTSHLTSKWRGTFQYYFFFNVENSIKREMRKNCLKKIKNFNPPPFPGIFFTNFLFNVGNSMEREENMEFFYFIFFNI